VGTTELGEGCCLIKMGGGGGWEGCSLHNLTNTHLGGGRVKTRGGHDGWGLFGRQESLKKQRKEKERNIKRGGGEKGPERGKIVGLSITKKFCWGLKLTRQKGAIAEATKKKIVKSVSPA